MRARTFQGAVAHAQHARKHRIGSGYGTIWLRIDDELVARTIAAKRKLSKLQAEVS